MGTKNGLLLLTAFCLYSTAWSEAPKTLRLVNLVYRHGDRSPVKLYPNYPKPVSTTWPQGLGWLTSDGMREQFALGNYLRRRYNGFLNENYIHTEISVHSSDTDRCLMSAYCNLAGLYPPSRDQEWNKNISWQPIPVHTRPNYEDNDLSEGELCPRYDQLFNATLKSDQVKKEEKENKAFYEFIVEKTGVVHETIRNIWQIADTLYCEQQHNVAWPSWVNNSIFDKLRNLETWGFDLRYQGREEQRLTGGCDFQCPFEKFVSLTKDVIPSDWKADCAIGGGATIIAVPIACGVILILVVIIAVMYRRRLRPTRQSPVSQCVHSDDATQAPSTSEQFPDLPTPRPMIPEQNVTTRRKCKGPYCCPDTFQPLPGKAPVLLQTISSDSDIEWRGATAVKPSTSSAATRPLRKCKMSTKKSKKGDFLKRRDYRGLSTTVIVTLCNAYVGHMSYILNPS